MINRTIERNGLKDTSARLGKGLITFCSLDQGILIDRYLKGIPADSRIRTDGRLLNENALGEKKLEQVCQLNDIARRRGQTLAQMALAWILQSDAITSVLTGASRPSQILDNVKAVENITFTPEELAEIDAIALG